jgi:hypothetical protein
MVCVPLPREVVEKEALPVTLNVPVPKTVEPSRKLTCPVGTPVALVTTTLKAAGLPTRVVDDTELSVVCVAVC